ncbi:Tail-specific protease [Ferriphaselus amnicola]|uniref:Tail-specific protease n=1 Tax=Ferriphaselus amnicola TaxID=1188319 RepID=A0A2Z6GA67_9PROT|nr:carboxy terminal-processing peptidase [Ferriphaselus amnicola]BBE50185.1 Tail-specific protease [Ferriphaselus amnicola]
MKNRLRWLLLALAVCVLNTGEALPQLHPQPEQSQAANISAALLTRHHYKKIPLNDETSAQIFDNYLKSLDSEKLYFLQSDIDQLVRVRSTMDDVLLKGDLRIPFAIYDLYQQRIAERINFARSLLTHGFDFTAQESYQYVRKNAPWASSQDELNELWRKRVKNDWLRLKLAGKDDALISTTLSKRYDNLLNSLAKIKSEDVFQSFMNAYATSIDPHTNYLGVRASQDFDISMKLSLVGIGAVLQTRDDYITIRELMAGGPAARSGKLSVGDRIVGVGQGPNSTPTDVMGWRIDDAVALIRGEENSVVLLDVIPAASGTDGEHKYIQLVRKKVSLDNQAANKSIIEIKNGQPRRIGVISLPGFYQDFEARQKGNKDFKSATRDVARLLAALKKEQVDGVIVDLRNNGGGSLSEAIELTGLFIDQGPVVQQRNSAGKITVASDDHAGVAWSGPLGVLINHASASASEIFAAAIQDYGRGIVIGEPSFGKGTVQSVIDLDQLVKSPNHQFGELKMTIAQFFRINGGTTQLRGVTPDISLPSFTDLDEFGESSYDNALPWTQISATDYTPAGNVADILPLLKTRHDARISTDEEFKYLSEDIAELNARRKNSRISLNEAERRKDRAMQEAKLKARKADQATAADVSAALQDDGLQSNERNLASDLAIESARKKAKDVLLNEAAHILSDEIELRITDARLVSGVVRKSEVH